MYHSTGGWGGLVYNLLLVTARFGYSMPPFLTERGSKINVPFWLCTQDDDDDDTNEKDDNEEIYEN
jgi:hypothetical protein